MGNINFRSKSTFYYFVEGVYKATIDKSKENNSEIDYESFYRVVTKELLKRKDS